MGLIHMRALIQGSVNTDSQALRATLCSAKMLKWIRKLRGRIFNTTELKQRIFDNE